MSKRIKVLIIDDSALVRAVLTSILSADPAIEVVGVAEDPLVARDLIKQLNPDVLTLDIEMPRMNGLTFLRNLMRLRPMPVVMVSTLTERGAPETLMALELGAVDFVPKPRTESGMVLEDYAGDICEKVKCAASARIRPLEDVALAPVQAPARQMSILGKVKPNYLCAVGASTGGTEAIKELLLQLPEDCPPILVSQHIPEAFSLSFAARLDKTCPMRVYHAEDGQPVERGAAYIAPGDDHLTVVRSSRGGYVCRLLKTLPVNRHRPSVDVLFESVVALGASAASGVLLTGMGADGARGLLAMRQAGHLTIAQDEASSVVWGMPAAAVKMDAAEKILPLRKIGAAILVDAVGA